MVEVVSRVLDKMSGFGEGGLRIGMILSSAVRCVECLCYTPFSS